MIQFYGERVLDAIGALQLTIDEIVRAMLGDSECWPQRVIVQTSCILHDEKIGAPTPTHIPTPLLETLLA